MEVLASASSVIAVASITIELANSIQKLVAFGKAVKNAPENVASLFKELELLSSVLDDCHHINQTLTFNSNDTKILETCVSRISQLQSLINGAGVNLTSNNRWKRTWDAFKITLKDREIVAIQASIRDAKATLHIVLQNSLT